VKIERIDRRATMRMRVVTVVLNILFLAGTVESNHIHQRDCRGAIRHIHLAVGRDPSTSMTVSFSSIDAFHEKLYGGVLIGTSPDKFDRVVNERNPSWYTAPQPTHLGGNYTSPYQHHVEITDLEPRTTYYYQPIVRRRPKAFKELEEILKSNDKQSEQLIASQINQQDKETSKGDADASRKLYNPLTKQDLQSEIDLYHSYLRYDQRKRRLAPPPYDSTKCQCPDPLQIRTFQTAAKPGHGQVKFAIVGDIGQFEHSEETWDHLRHHSDGISAVILAGDLAYTAYDHRRWDTFMDFFDDYPLIDRIPMMITPGNHDIDKSEHGTELFLAFENRFRMPHIKSPKLGFFDGPDGSLNMDRPPYPLPYEWGNAFYSYLYGPTHQIFLSSYSAMEPGSPQYEWFKHELKTVDRKRTPWLIVTYHVPIYNTFRVHQHDTQMIAARKHIEPLLVKHKVNLVFNGHIHAYLRTTNVAKQKKHKDGPIHIVMGAGGRNADAAFLADEPEDWVEMRDGTIYGYGILEICNNTHARWDWVHTGKKSDHNVVFGEDVVLPPGGVDHTFIQNTYFTK